MQTAGYVVGPSGEQLTEVDASNNWKHTNVYAGGKQIGTYDGNVSAPTLHFYFDDPLGTRRAQTNSSGVLEATYQSLPFGDGLAQNPVTTTDDPTENHFTGKERDTESGNDYFLARYYNSATGRFLSPDWSAMLEPVPYAKLGDPQTLNLYAYMENNPIRGIDPDGHDGCYADDMPTDCSLLTSENSVADESDTEKFADALIGYNERDQLAKDKAKERVGKTTVGSLARTMTNEDGSLSGGAPGELEKGKTALANAIINNAGLAVPAPVAPDTGTASDQDTEIMDDAYTNRVNGGADPVQGRSQYGTTQNPNVKYRDANNKMHGVAGQRPYTLNLVLSQTPLALDQLGLSSITTPAISHDIQERPFHEEYQVSNCDTALFRSHRTCSATDASTPISCCSLSGSQGLPATFKRRKAHFWVPS